MLISEDNYKFDQTFKCLYLPKKNKLHFLTGTVSQTEDTTLGVKQYQGRSNGYE